MTRRGAQLVPALTALLVVVTATARASLPSIPSETTSASVETTSATKSTGPAMPHWVRVLLLSDHNTRVVMLGTTLLGLAAGSVGTFTLLRRRALMGDALSHATLPGVGMAFLIAQAAGFDPRSLPLLLSGAAVSGLCGVAAIMFIRNLPRLREDAALGIVLSVFFGAGVAILSVVQKSGGNAAGLESYIYGKTASLTATDARLIAWTGFGVLIVILMCFRELTLLCFDEGFAASRGYPVVALDMLLMAIVVIVTIVGLQAVGLILMIALLVIPAAAARFWTDHLPRMTWISAAIGGIAGLIGSAISGIFADLPSGAMIVLVSSALFFVSMIFGRKRGVAIRLLRRRALNAAIDREHLLRGIWELHETDESRIDEEHGVEFQDLLAIRSWSPSRLSRQIEASLREGLVRRTLDGRILLTRPGLAEAKRLVHNHRLWELYLITHADVAAARVDREADAIEHVLGPELILRLEKLMDVEQPGRPVPASPHELRTRPVTGARTEEDTRT